MALETPCQTHDAVYNTVIEADRVSMTVTLPFALDLTAEQAEVLEANMHNVMELVLAPFWR